MTHKKESNLVSFRLTADQLKTIDKMRAPYGLSRGGFIKYHITSSFLIEAQKTAPTMEAE